MDAKRFSVVVASLIVSAIFIFSVVETVIGLCKATAWQGFGGIMLMIFGLIALINIFMSLEDWFN